MNQQVWAAQLGKEQAWERAELAGRLSTAWQALPSPLCPASTPGYRRSWGDAGHKLLISMYLHLPSPGWLRWYKESTYDVGDSGSIPGESTYDVGDSGSIPGLGRSPGEGNGNPLQYSYLQNSMDRGAWQYSPWSPKEMDMTEWLSIVL